MLNKNQEIYNYIFYYDNILRDNFAKADKDKDGFLNFSEYHNLLNSYGYEISQKETKHRFNQVDLNRDGLISFEEYKNYNQTCNSFETLIKEYTDMFNGMDKNMDGYITKNDLKHGWKKEGIDLKNRTLRTIIKNFDVNFDKKISLNEYLNFIKAHHIESLLKDQSKRHKSKSRVRIEDSSNFSQTNKQSNRSFPNYSKENLAKNYDYKNADNDQMVFNIEFNDKQKKKKYTKRREKEKPLKYNTINANSILTENKKNRKPIESEFVIDITLDDESFKDWVENSHTLTSIDSIYTNLNQSSLKHCPTKSSSERKLKRNADFKINLELDNKKPGECIINGLTQTSKDKFVRSNNLRSPSIKVFGDKQGKSKYLFNLLIEI